VTWHNNEKEPGRGKRVVISKNDTPLLELPVHDSNLTAHNLVNFWNYENGLIFP
jgi:hypothetical protein